MSQSSYNLLKDIEILLMSNIDDKDVYNELVSRISFIFNEYDIEKSPQNFQFTPMRTSVFSIDTRLVSWLKVKLHLR